MIVLIAGMPRSGSTFSFNVASKVLGRYGSVRNITTNSLIDVVEKETHFDHTVIKSHNSDAATLFLVRNDSMKVICTVRKPEDAIASWMQTFGFSLEQSIDSMIEWLRIYNIIRPHALVIRYRQIDMHPFIAAWRIAQTVRPGTSPLEVLKIARGTSKAKVKEFSDNLKVDDLNTVDIGFSYFDDKSFFHRRHVSSIISRNAIQIIGDDAVAVIRERLSGFISSDGEIQ